AARPTAPDALPFAASRPSGEEATARGPPPRVVRLAQPPPQGHAPGDRPARQRGLPAGQRRKPQDTDDRRAPGHAPAVRHHVPHGPRPDPLRPLTPPPPP